MRTMSNRQGWARLGLALIFFLPLGGQALAANSGRWTLQSVKDFSQGQRERLRLNENGVLSSGYTSTNMGDVAKEIWCSAVDGEGSIYFGTGSPSDLFVMDQAKKISRLIEFDALAVTAIDDLLHHLLDV